MSPLNRILLFFVLPIIAVLLYPPQWLVSGLAILPFVLILFIGLGWLLMRGRSLALTLSIFIQGFNVIIHLMMFYPHIIDVTTSQFDFTYMITSLAGLVLSMYLMLRLDQPDVRVTMVT